LHRAPSTCSASGPYSTRKRSAWPADENKAIWFTRLAADMPRAD
jgi:hypothetical protein